jgi:hypothetical protein
MITGAYYEFHLLTAIGLILLFSTAAMVFTIEKIHRITTGENASDRRLNAIVDLLFKRNVRPK